MKEDREYKTLIYTDFGEAWVRFTKDGKTGEVRVEMADYPGEEVDEYAELKVAFAAGKRIAWRVKGGKWYATDTPTWRTDGFEYKVIADDIVHTETFCHPDFGDTIKVEFTRFGLDGKTAVKVVE